MVEDGKGFDLSPTAQEEASNVETSDSKWKKWERDGSTLEKDGSTLEIYTGLLENISTLQAEMKRIAKDECGIVCID